MHRWWWVSLLLWMAVQVQAAEYRIGPAPSWVAPLPVDLERKLPNAQLGGELYLLSDVQSRIEATGRVSYFHYASKALDAEGVHSIADMSFVFDPSFEQFTLHALRVWRGGQVSDKLAGAKITVLQRETELEYRIFDGSKTVSVVLDDLRVGDVVEYAYSRRGINPVFGNRVAEGAELQWSVPVAHTSVRLLVPNGRPLATQLLNSTLQPEVSALGAYREYRWSQQDVPGLKVEPGAPQNYSPYAQVRWSEYADWAAVVNWGLPLYRTGGKLGPALHAVIANIRRTVPDPQAQVREVLRMVQTDIRYLGVEVGAGSYVPSAPDTVFQRRFGDCKDKALLVIAMLRELGVAAAPALVNTVRREAVGNYLPAPNVFNHVVVRVTMDGRHYWLDPTLSPQGGDLQHLVQSDHGLALVLEKGETGLSKMAGQAGSSSKRVKAVFDGLSGPEKPMRYTITTTAYGVEADRIRNQMARHGAAHMQTQYVNYYARRYPEIKVAEPLRHVDDMKLNQLTTVESYLIPDFWKDGGEGKRRKGYIRSSEIRGQLSRPDYPNRNSPLATGYPQEIEEITEVKLRDKWDVTPQDIQVKDAAFEFQHKVERGQGDVKYLITDRVRWIQSQVEPGKVRDYAANLSKAYDEVGLTLNLGKSQRVVEKERLAQALGGWSQALQACVLFSMWGVLAFVCSRSPEEHRPLNWYLLRQLVWISGALWILATAFPSSWKTQTLAIIVVFIGSRMILAGAAHAPATHWQYAHVDPAVLASKRRGVRYLVYGLNVLPLAALACGIAFYCGALLN